MVKPQAASAYLLSLGLILAVSPKAGADSASFGSDHDTPTEFEKRIMLNSRWDLGYHLFQLQEYAAAAEEFEKIRQVLPNDASLLALIGSCYSMSGRWDQGEKALLEAKAQNPDDEDINSLLGQFYLSAGHSLKGATYLEHALRISPDQDALRARLASLYLDAGQGERARYHLEFILNARGGVDFGNPEMDHDYARLLLNAGRYEEGLVFAERAYAADAANPSYARLLGLLFMRAQRYGEAARMLSVGRNELQAEETIYLQWGEALFLDRRWADAEVAWLEGVKRLPGSFELLARMVDYYLGAANPERARRVLAFAEARHPGHPGNLLLQARLHRKLSSYSLAGKALIRLKRQACGSLAKEALWEEAQLAFATGKFADCGKILDHLVLADHRKAEANVLKSKLALRAGNRMLVQARPDTGLADPYAFARPRRN